MKLAIVMPVVLQNEAMLQVTVDAWRSIRIDRSWAVETVKLFWSMHLICNRLSVLHPTDLHALMKRELHHPSAQIPYLTQVRAEQERTVAGAWNQGIREALEIDADLVLLMGNDVRLRPETVCKLVEYAVWKREHDPLVAVWTGANAANQLTDGAVTDGANFDLAMLEPRTVALHGTFDENFRPAYFEDNDFYGRVVLGGGHCRVVHDARFDHLGSATIHHDAEMAHHVRHWFPLNRDYFVRKWGVAPAQDESGVKATYHRHPFAVGHRPLSWWELEEGRR